jgi:hypothetical protein
LNNTQLTELIFFRVVNKLVAEKNDLQGFLKGYFLLFLIASCSLGRVAFEQKFFNFNKHQSYKSRLHITFRVILRLQKAILHGLL